MLIPILSGDGNWSLLAFVAPVGVVLTTNDPQHVRFRELRLVAAVAAAGLVIFALAATLLFLDGSVAWICGALLPLPSFGFHWFYGRWFDRNRFDLMQQPAPT